MKLRKGILSVCIIALIMLLGVTSDVNAALAEQPKFLGIEEYRASGLGYKAIEKIKYKQENNFQIGTDVVFTMESSSVPISSKQIEKVIKQYFA